MRWGEILAATALSHLEISHQKLERRSPGEDDFPPVKASPNLGFLGEKRSGKGRGANPFPVRWGEILAATATSIVGEMQSGRSSGYLWSTPLQLF